MKIYGYHEPMDLGGYEASPSLVEGWVRSWRAAGLEPVLLGAVDAAKHPAADRISNDAYFGGKLNLPQYERACFRRWLAIEMANAAPADSNEPFLVADTDCFWSGRLVPRLALQEMAPGFLSDERSPWLMLMTAAKAVSIVSGFITSADNEVRDVDGHVSDQYLLSLRPDFKEPTYDGVTMRTTICASNPAWAIHFPNRICGRTLKEEAIMEAGLWR